MIHHVLSHVLHNRSHSSATYCCIWQLSLVGCLIAFSAADDQAAALYAELDTHDKQHLSITLLLHDNDQLQAKLTEAEQQIQQLQISEAGAHDAWKAAEFQLAQSQVTIFKCEI